MIHTVFPFSRHCSLYQIRIRIKIRMCTLEWLLELSSLVQLILRIIDLATGSKRNLPPLVLKQTIDDSSTMLPLLILNSQHTRLGELAI